MAEKKEKIDISVTGIEKLLTQSLENFQEERDLALERYRRQDEAMATPEDFIMQGKNAVDYLKTAADRSNAILSVAKMLTDIVYKNGQGGEGAIGGTSGSGDAQKAMMLKMMKELEDNKE